MLVLKFLLHKPVIHTPLCATPQGATADVMAMVVDVHRTLTGSA